MKISYLILIVFLFPLTMNGQTEKLTKKEKKALKAKESEEKLMVLYKAVESQQFVVETDQVFGDDGSVFNVSPMMNFFTIDSTQSTIQLSFTGLIGWNNVGGVTVDGVVDKFDLHEFKAGKPITLIGSINQRSGGNTQFTMYVYSSGMANVTISGNWGSSITFQGRLFTLAESKVYKGVPLN